MENFNLKFTCYKINKLYSLQFIKIILYRKLSTEMYAERCMSFKNALRVNIA